jgi:hypothetical protein
MGDSPLEGRRCGGNNLVGLWAVSQVAPQGAN